MAVQDQTLVSWQWQHQKIYTTNLYSLVHVSEFSWSKCRKKKRFIHLDFLPHFLISGKYRTEPRPAGFNKLYSWRSQQTSHPPGYGKKTGMSSGNKKNPSTLRPYLSYFRSHSFIFLWFINVQSIQMLLLKSVNNFAFSYLC